MSCKPTPMTTSPAADPTSRSNVGFQHGSSGELTLWLRPEVQLSPTHRWHSAALIVALFHPRMVQLRVAAKTRCIEFKPNPPTAADKRTNV